jgi:hypothetical protein
MVQAEAVLTGARQAGAAEKQVAGAAEPQGPGEDAEASALVASIMEETELEERMRAAGIEIPKPGPEADAAPAAAQEDADESDKWCCICVEDAVFRCGECDNDVFCARCFRESHSDPDTKGHKPARLAQESSKK